MARSFKGSMSVLMTVDGVGGVWNYALRLIEGLRPFHVHVTLAVMGPALDERQRQEAGRLDNLTLCESTFKLEWMQDPWDDVDRAGQWLLNLEKSLRPDVIHLNGFVHASLPWSHPVMVVAHSCVCSWFESVRRSEPTAEWDEYRRRVRHALERADSVTAPTTAALRSLGKHYGPFKAAGAIYNGCDAVEDSAGKTDEIVFTAGRLWDPAKNVAVLDRAAKSMPWPVVAAGPLDGPDGQHSEFHSIRCLGPLDPTALGPWFRRAALFVTPSLYEPFGLAALEAGLAGCTLVLADIPSLREIWGQAAIFFPPRDHRALAREIDRLMEWPSLRQQYSRRAQTKARTYTVARMAARYFRQYCDLIQSEAVSADEALTVGSL
jgi:glycogen synthase